MRLCGGEILYQNLGIEVRVGWSTFLLLGQMISGGSFPTEIVFSAWLRFGWGLKCLRNVILDRGNKSSLLSRIWRDWGILVCPWPIYGGHYQDSLSIRP